MNDEAQKAFFEAGQFFNPVDIVCSTKRYDGTSYNLQSFINPKTAFVSSKSLEGRELKALEWSYAPLANSLCRSTYRDIQSCEGSE